MMKLTILSLYYIFLYYIYITFSYLTFFLFVWKIRRAKTLAYLSELATLFSPSAYRNALRFAQLTNKELSRSIVSKFETGGGRSRGDCAPLISSLNIHEEGRESKRVRERERERERVREVIVYFWECRLCRACSVHNERKVFFKFHKGSAEKRHAISSEKRSAVLSLCLSFSLSLLFAVNFERMTMIPLQWWESDPIFPLSPR